MQLVYPHAQMLASRHEQRLAARCEEPLGGGGSNLGHFGLTELLRRLQAIR
jgi:hypothetical protein